MHSQIWVVSTLLISIVLIVLTIEVQIPPVSGAVAGQLLRGNDDGYGATGYGKCY